MERDPLMSLIRESRCVLAFATACATFSTVLSSQAWAVGRPSISSGFVAVANETANLTDSSGNPIVTDSRRSVTFFDSNNIGNGPLFSVALPFEGQAAPNASAYEEFSAMTADPSTGDIYILAFDNTSPSDTALQYGVDTDGFDTTGDFDLYKINFQTVLNNWKTNFQGKDARTLGGALALSGPAPNVPVGGTATTTPPNTNPALTADLMKDYITYGVTTPYSAEVTASTLHMSPNGATDATHSNAFVLNGAIEKIGEINRNRYASGSNFFNPTLNFISQSQMFMIDDTRQLGTLAPNVANDNDYRIINRVSTSPGLATVSNNPTAGVRTEVDGGFNKSTTQSWESKRIGQAFLDTDETTSGSTLSEMQSSAYYNAGSVRGVWVADRDRANTISKNQVPDFEALAPTPGGDDIAFLQLDASGNSLGYRTFSSNNATKFDMDNDPGGTAHGPGHVGQLFTATNGDLIVVEEGYDDSVSGTVPNNLPNSEPAVIRGTVNYDNGGKISITWGQKMYLNPAKQFDNSKSAPSTFKVDGWFSSYDAATNKVYFAEPGSSNFTPQFQMNWHVLDLNTGLTSSFENMDESVSLFVSNTNFPNGQKVVSFSLPTGVAGDYNGDGIVNAADYTVWRDHLGQSTTLPNDSTPGMVTQADYDVWKANFGMSSPGSGAGSRGAGAVPEPGSVALLVMGLIGLVAGRRRFGR
jgi:hypothetical protein